ncbi:hypothetical protein FBU31_000865 [Coemansia sp. 'formosensis']|nr:hypothetical protein FBU31_000865 [Coemansia sp. 'formosensis']
MLMSVCAKNLDLRESRGVGGKVDGTRLLSMSQMLNGLLKAETAEIEMARLETEIADAVVNAETAETVGTVESADTAESAEIVKSAEIVESAGIPETTETEVTVGVAGRDRRHHLGPDVDQCA